MESVAELVARLHRIPPPRGSLHDAAAEAVLVRRWMGHLRTWDPCTHAKVVHLVDPVSEALAEGGAGRPVVTVHRDLHDGQVLVHDVRVSLLDPDTVAAGERELDLGNLVAHLRLAVHQQRCTEETAATMAEVLIGSYGGSDIDRQRLETYTTSAMLRLVAVHALRPSTRSCLEPLLADLGVAH